jgi:mannose-6-phosphate isomerase-like protein (cupin superfamily)
VTSVGRPSTRGGGPVDRHEGADQWLYAVSGVGVEGERVEPREGTRVLIGRGERHEIRNTGDAPLGTRNVYVPPAYAGEGDEVPAGRAG